MRENVTDVYELSPLQRGMLLRSLHDGARDMYVSQHTYLVTGSLEVDALVSGWEAAMLSHPAMRTSYHWDGTDKPLQVVHDRLAMTVRRLDWSQHASGAGRDPRMLDQVEFTRLQDLVAADSTEGFELTEPPLQRLHVIRLGEQRRCLVWTYHHLLLDGWSVGIFLNNVMSHYRRLVFGGPPPRPAAPFRDYIGWLQRQPSDGAEDFFSSTLAGLDPPALLALSPPAAQPTGAVERHIVSLPKELEEGLQVVAGRHQVTVATVIQAAWAVVLTRLTGEHDVVLGCASSGRPAELVDVDRMVGVFANTLPVPVSVPTCGPLGPWLHTLQNEYAEIRRWDFTPLHDVQRWAGSAGRPLFDNLLVLENYPTAIDDADLIQQRLTFRRLALYDKTDIPLTLTVNPEPVSEMHLLLHRDRFPVGYAEQILDCLYASLAALGSAEDDLESVLAAVRTAARSSSPAMGASAQQDRADDRKGPVDPGAADLGESEIAAVFAAVLEVDRVDPGASFFGLGGDSFAAVNAITRIPGASLAMLATHPSARELAAALGDPPPAAASTTDLGPVPASNAVEVPLRRLTRMPSWKRSSAAGTVVCVPYGGGSVVSCQPLARALQDRLDVLAVELPGHEPDHRTRTGVGERVRTADQLEAFAERVVEQLTGGTGIDQDVPLAVYGHSTGVALAVALAQRLEARGRRVDRLFLAASYPFFEHGPIGWIVHRQRESAERLVAELRRLHAAHGLDGAAGGLDLELVSRAASDDLASGRAYFSRRWSRVRPGGGRPLNTPITVLADPDDPATPRIWTRWRRWARFGSVADLQTVTGAGHFFHQQDPASVATIIRSKITGSARTARAR